MKRVGKTFHCSRAGAVLVEVFLLLTKCGAKFGQGHVIPQFIVCGSDFTSERRPWGLQACQPGGCDDPLSQGLPARGAETRHHAGPTGSKSSLCQSMLCINPFYASLQTPSCYVSKCPPQNLLGHALEMHSQSPVPRLAEPTPPAVGPRSLFLFCFQP